MTPTAQPWYRSAQQLAEGNRYCTCCERKLVGHVRMLELDQRSNTYHDLGGVPDDQSQGWFPFGIKCARKKLSEHSAKPTLDQLLSAHPDTPINELLEWDETRELAHEKHVADCREMNWAGE